MTDEPHPRRKGRPPTTPAPYPNGPMDDWLRGFAPSAQQVLRAARALLLEKGYEALTLETVALEAGEEPATIRRHFGTRAGLIQALFDYLGEEAYRDLQDAVQQLPLGERRTHALVRGCGRLARDRQLAMGMFELTPHAIREPVLRERFAALYAWYLKTMLEESGIADRVRGITAYEDRRDAETLPAIIMSVIDGLSLQLSLDPSSVDVDRAFALLDLFVSAVLDGRLRTVGRLGTSDSD